ncbi:MAG: GNAT family N-acetyltransferase [Planctomycetota bacterium]
MRHDIVVEGPTFRLRPVRVEDAAIMVEIRTGDPLRSRFMNPTSPDVSLQVAYLEAYLERETDAYFVVERRGSAEPEGLVAVYDIGEEGPGRAEWGRWVLRPGSVAALESAWLTYRAAFEHLDLDLVYCRTVAANEQVVTFHDSCGLVRHGTLPGYVTIGDVVHDSVEHRLDRTGWPAVDRRLGALVERYAARGR